MTEETSGSDLQKRLAADVSGETRDAIHQQLENQSAKLKAKMDSGVSPTEFDGLEKQHDALQAGAEIVTLAWSRHHAS